MKLHYDSDIQTLCFLLTRRVSALQPAGSINHKYPNETSVRIKGTSARSNLRKMILHAQFFKRFLSIQIISRILLHAYSIESTIEGCVENKVSPFIAPIKFQNILYNTHGALRKLSMVHTFKNFRTIKASSNSNSDDKALVLVRCYRYSCIVCELTSRRMNLYQIRGFEESFPSTRTI